jgi:hypothetical protein
MHLLILIFKKDRVKNHQKIEESTQLLMLIKIVNRILKKKKKQRKIMMIQDKK